MRRTIAAFVLFAGITASGPVWAQPRQGEEIALWPGIAPGSEGVSITLTVVERSKDPARPNRATSLVTRPTLTAYVPDKPNGTALIIAPGGAYARVVTDKEGADVARVFNAAGVTAFVLTYRMPGDGHAAGPLTPLQDAQRALRLVRAQASAWHLNPARIGMMGFSAGGHVAASLATGFDRQVYAAVDAADTQSARPDFLLLLYPVVTMRDGIAHSGSRAKLFPGVASAEAMALASPELHVTAQTPPTFIALANDDADVDPQNSVLFYQALRAAKIPAELVIFGQGGHGFGLDPNTEAGLKWPALAVSWVALRP